MELSLPTDQTGTSDGPGELVLVDRNDQAIGTSTKLAAHQPPGQLHRALSAFVLHDDGVLLQRRAAGKYHFPGLWSNSCCTHPRPGEDTVAAGERRLGEELGLRCRLTHVGSFTYRAVDPVSGLVEHEVDHVLVGHSSADPEPNPEEADDTMVMDLDELGASLERFPERYTPWLAEALEVLATGRSAPGTPAPIVPGEVPAP